MLNLKLALLKMNFLGKTERPKIKKEKLENWQLMVIFQPLHLKLSQEKLQDHFIVKALKRRKIM